MKWFASLLPGLLGVATGLGAAYGVSACRQAQPPPTTQADGVTPVPVMQCAVVASQAQVYFSCDVQRAFADGALALFRGQVLSCALEADDGAPVRALDCQVTDVAVAASLRSEAASALP